MVDNFRPGFEPDVAVDPRTGQTYNSEPFGFSTTQSFVWRSDDQRRSFHLAEGNVAGKTSTCVGGGDSELKVDPVDGDLYFVDLQGLTNFTASRSTDHGKTWQTSCTSVNGTGVDRQWLGIDTNGGSTAVGGGAHDGRLYLDYDNVEQNTDTGSGGQNTLGNQLVMNESLDGVHYGANCATPGAPCPLPPAVISADEGIPGNIVVNDVAGSRYQHAVYAIHTGSLGNSVIVSACRGAEGDTDAAQVAADCTDPTKTRPDTGRVNEFWHDSFPRPAGNFTTGNLFASLAIDRAGNLYAVWSQYPTASAGSTAPIGPGAVYLAVSTDGAQHWSRPTRVSPAGLPNSVMPWVTAGSAGRVAIAFEGAPQATNAHGQYGPDTLDNGTWNVYLAQSTNATSTQPSFQLAKVSDHQNKYGTISTQGLGGSPDRSLGDFLQVTSGTAGQAVVSYVDDTSADRNGDTCGGCGQTPPEAAGPTIIATQDSGPSLYASHGTLTPRTSDAATASVTDATGDGYYASAGRATAGSANLDVTAVRVQQVHQRLKISMSTADDNLAHDLAVDPTLGGDVGEWLVRWAAPAYHKPNGNGGFNGDGNIFYAGMESVRGGPPAFYTGSTGSINTTHPKYFTYPMTTTVPGSITGNSINWWVPLRDIGSPAAGDELYSVTGFTDTQAYSNLKGTPVGGQGQVGDENIPNLIDAAPPLTFTAN
ncbi:MAG: hypothetical protein ACRDP1_03820 [Nocardioidaceae bacterium]